MVQVHSALERTVDFGSARIVKDNLAERARERMHGLAESLGNLLMEAFHYLALFAIGAITAWAAVMAFLGMLEKGHITVDDSGKVFHLTVDLDGDGFLGQRFGDALSKGQPVERRIGFADRTIG